MGKSNKMYVAARNLSQGQRWLPGATSSSKNYSTSLNAPSSIYATHNGDVYVDNGDSNHTIDLWTSNLSTPIVSMHVNHSCSFLFVDAFYNLYCSTDGTHQVIRHKYGDDVDNVVIIAGNGVNGSAANMLNQPRGIFVNIYMNLYVADCKNDRIQWFEYGSLNGMTVIGNFPQNLLNLSCPTSINFDYEGNLFVMDSNNHRILQKSSTGVRCVIGCSGSGGPTSIHLFYPKAFSFDTDGNIYVLDSGNSRIQRFYRFSESCGELFSPLRFIFHCIRVKFLLDFVSFTGLDLFFKPEMLRGYIP
jgi:hypothetical protein